MYRTIYVLVFVLILSVTSFSQTTVDFEGSTYIDDTWIREGAATTNYGSNITGRIQANLFNVERVLFKMNSFPTDSIPANANIIACTLQVYFVSMSGTFTPNIYQVCPAWVEAQATWNIYSTGNNWATAGCGNASGATCASCGSEDRKTGNMGVSAASGNGYKNFPIDTCLANGWLSGSATNSGVIFDAPSPSNTSMYLSEASSAFYTHWIFVYVEETGVPSVRHSSDGNGIRHSPDGASVRHGG